MAPNSDRIDDALVSNVVVAWLIEEIEEHALAEDDLGADDALFDILGIILARLISMPSKRRLRAATFYKDSQTRRARPLDTPWNAALSELVANLESINRRDPDARQSALDLLISNAHRVSEMERRATYG
jgi:hypothetical protein